MKPQKGDILPSGNFMLRKKITSLFQFEEYTNGNEFVYFRHKLYHKAFVHSMSYNTIVRGIRYGWFYEVYDLRAKKKVYKIIDTVISAGERVEVSHFHNPYEKETHLSR